METAGQLKHAHVRDGQRQLTGRGVAVSIHQQRVVADYPSDVWQVPGQWRDGGSGIESPLYLRWQTGEHSERFFHSRPEVCDEF